MWSDVMQGDVMFCFVKYVLCPFVWCCGSEICSTASLSQDIETDMEQGKDISAEEVERTCKRMHWQLLQTLRQINLIPVVISYINRMKLNVCNMLRATSGYGYLCRLSPIVWIACICLHMPAWPVWLVECHQAAILASLARAQGPELNWRAPPPNWRFQREGNRGK